MKNKKTKIILASASPRRIALLRNIGCKFEIIPSKIKEKINPKLSPVENIKKLSYSKALAVASRISKGIVIAADTDNILNGKIFGKPRSKKEARRMLRSVSGKEHKVITAITVMDVKNKKVLQDVVVTRVKFRKLNENLIKRYLNCGENILDKAGAYAIQGKGALLIESINGDYYNVVGLPLNALNKLLEKFGVDLFNN
jgi:septum formation protein